MRRSNNGSAHAQAIALARTTKEYRNLYKPYRRVEGYFSWNQVAAKLASLIGVGNTTDFSHLDQTYKEVIQAAKLAELNDIPAYWLDKKLAEAFVMSDLPKQIGKPALVMPHFILILPTGMFTNPDSFAVSWISVEYLQQNQQFPDLHFDRQVMASLNRVDADKIRWTMMTENGYLYNANTEMKQSVEDNFLLNSGEFDLAETVIACGANTNTTTENEFIDLINKLVYQVLLYLQLQPEAITEVPPKLLQATAGVGFSPSKQQKQPMLNPRMIGRDYQHYTRKATKRDEEDRRKYQIHTLSWWRRGYWRSQPIGKREEGQRKLILIPPVHIFREKGDN